MADFGLIKSFDIDNGELDDVTKQTAFVLGYELAQIDHLLKRVEPISRPVHTCNKSRIEKSCKESGRQYFLKWLHGDRSESWMQLDVAPMEKDDA